jgi:hypothetical protein
MDITGIGSVLDFGSKIIDRLWPDPAQRDAAKLELFKAQQAGEFKEMDQAFEIAKAQIGVNAVEAGSSDKFTSRARPFIMWICGFSLLYAALIEPFARFIAVVTLHYSGSFPVINTDLTLQLLFGLLGLGAYRTVEKVKGVAK